MEGLLWELSGVVDVAVEDDVLPLTAAAPMLFAQVVVGPMPVTKG
jgi:hypothetical protein